MKYQLKNYGEDVLIEITKGDEGNLKEITESLPPDMQARIMGYRLVAAIVTP